MPDIRHDIKNDLRLCGKSQADLSRATGIPYRRLSGAVSGYWFLSAFEESQIRRQIDRWQAEQNPMPTGTGGQA